MNLQELSCCSPPTLSHAFFRRRLTAAPISNINFNPVHGPHNMHRQGGLLTTCSAPTLVMELFRIALSRPFLSTEGVLLPGGPNLHLAAHPLAM